MTDYSLKKTLIQIFDVPIEVARRFKQDRLTRHAAALSFSSLLAVAPMMALAFSILSLFASFDELSQSFESIIYQFLAPAVGEDLKHFIDQFTGQARQLSVVGLLFFFLTAILLMFNIEDSFNDIFRAETRRSILARLPIYWMMVTLGPLSMGASLTISTYVLSLSVIAGDSLSNHIQSAGVLVLPFLLEVFAFTLLYLILPSVKVRVLNAFIGALVASVLFEVSKKAFAIYLLNFGSYEVIYGALSALPIFLIWIYLSWIIALLGAQVVSVLKHKQALACKADSDCDELELAKADGVNL